MASASRLKLDNRIRTQIENGVATGHRNMFAVVGNKARDQVSTLYHILMKSTVSARPNVLWCYKKDLGFTSHRKKRMREIKRKTAISNATVNDADPFEVFVSSTQIRYCYYNETHTILGNTYGVLVLQDFEALTPNLLARTIETVEGGGLVILLLKSVNSLRQLYTMAMDVHNRYRTESHNEVVARFNERFILSLASCKSITVIDDQFNVLPISSHIAKVEPVSQSAKKQISPSDSELKSMKEAMSDTKPIGPLLSKCKTACQGKALLRLLDVITEKNLNVTCSLTAARGRGKSASLGLALAGAIAFGYTNIFVTSPSPENLRTLFEFVVKGFDVLEYEEHTDYELVQSTNPEFRKALVRINIFREHRQTIQYIHPSDASKLGQAEIVVVDEAAAIPLPLVKDLISGPYLVFLASTINGYEGTGRSLSLKLLQQLRQQAAGSAKGMKAAMSKGRTLHEMTLEESIRYKPGDQIEQWLTKVLCLDASSASQKLGCGTPPPKQCELYYVNRETLFSFHTASEAFLQQLMAIYVAAHYKNSPNDLQMLSDAPAHHLFVLMAPVDKNQSSIPEILTVVQVCMEGQLSKSSVKDSLEQGRRAAGDLVPWTISQQFLDRDFPTLCGGRVVRIAVHPDYQSMGYGSEALRQLEKYYKGEMTSLDESEHKKAGKETMSTVTNGDTVALLEEQVAPRANVPPLLLRLSERKPEALDYIGVSFGITLPLLKFWKRACYVPVYLRQTANDLTGEYTCIVLKTLHQQDDHDDEENQGGWLPAYWSEFRRRLVQLLSFEFSKFSSQLALSLLHLKNKSIEKSCEPKPLTRAELNMHLSNLDLRRLSEYSRSMLDHQLVTDLLPTVARLYFTGKISGEAFKLSVIQAAVLLGLGLQHKTVEKISEELDMPQNQILALHVKSIRKISDALDTICTDAIKERMNTKTDANGDDQEMATAHMKPLEKSLEDELDDAATEIRSRQERDKKTMLQELGKELKRYEITATDKDLQEAMGGVDMKFSRKITSTISVKSKRPINTAEVPDEVDRLATKKMKMKKNKMKN